MVFTTNSIQVKLNWINLIQKIFRKKPLILGLKAFFKCKYPKTILNKIHRKLTKVEICEKKMYNYCDKF